MTNVTPIRPDPFGLEQLRPEGGPLHRPNLNPEVIFHEPKKLRVGDLVHWRGGWGTNPPRLARVKLIELNCNSLAENGECVAECSWEEARKASTVVDLENGSWAYGDQISPV